MKEVVLHGTSLDQRCYQLALNEQLKIQTQKMEGSKVIVVGNPIMSNCEVCRNEPFLGDEYSTPSRKKKVKCTKSSRSGCNSRKNYTKERNEARKNKQQFDDTDRLYTEYYRVDILGRSYRVFPSEESTSEYCSLEEFRLSDYWEEILENKYNAKMEYNHPTFNVIVADNGDYYSVRYIYYSDGTLYSTHYKLHSNEQRI